MAKYRRKEVEAVQWTGDNFAALANLIMHDAHGTDDGKIIIPTPNGDMVVDIGDWVVKGDYGEILPIKPDVFEQAYELAV